METRAIEGPSVEENGVAVQEDPKTSGLVDGGSEKKNEEPP